MTAIAGTRTPSATSSRVLVIIGRPALFVRGLLVLIVPLVLWQLLGDPKSFDFPTPSTWATALHDMYTEGDLVPAAQRTLLTFFISLVVATVVGTVLGILIGASDRIDRALSPILDYFRATPGVALVPVLSLILGNGLFSSVTIVVAGIVWPILLNTIMGMRSIPRVRLEMAQSLSLGRWARVTRVIIPSLGPHVTTGVRISVSLSLIVTLVTDVMGTGEGLGRLLIDKQSLYESPAVWGLLFVIGAFGYVITLLFGLLERRLFARWPEDARPVV